MNQQEHVFDLARAEASCLALSHLLESLGEKLLGETSLELVKSVNGASYLARNIAQDIGKMIVTVSNEL